MKFTVTNAVSTSASKPAFDDGNRFRDATKTVYVSGTLNGTSVELEISPDESDALGSSNGVSDAGSRWFTPSGCVFNSIDISSFATFVGRFRKARAKINGTAGGDNITVEVV